MTDSTSTGPAPQEILKEQVHILYRNNVLASLAAIFAATVLGIVLWFTTTESIILPWIGAFIGLFIVRAMITRSYFAHHHGANDSQVWRNYMLMTAIAAGLIWLIGVIALFPSDYPHHQAMMGFVIAAVIAGAVPYLSAVWPVYLLSTVPMGLAYAGLLITQDSDNAVAMGLLMLVLVFMLILVSWRMNQTLIEYIRLRFTKEKLASELDYAQEIKEQAKQVAKESDERVAVLADAPFEGIFIHEFGQILDANRTALNMLQLESEDVIGKQILDFIPVEHHAAIIAEIAAPSGKVFHATARRSDGTSIHFEVRGRTFPRRGRTIRVVSLRERAQ